MFISCATSPSARQRRGGDRRVCAGELAPFPASTSSSSRCSRSTSAARSRAPSTSSCCRSRDLAALRDIAPQFEDAHAAHSRHHRREHRPADPGARQPSSISTATRASRLGSRSTRSAPRSTPPSAAGRSRRSTRPSDTYQVILEADRRYADVNERAAQIMSARPAARWCRSTRWPSVKRQPTSLTVNHIGQLPAVTDLVQPGARRLARRGRRPHRGRRRASVGLPAQHRHELPGHRAGLPGGARQPGHAAVRRRARDLHRARHALRELHPSADDPLRPAVGRHRRAADADAVRHGPAASSR